MIVTLKLNSMDLPLNWISALFAFGAALFSYLSWVRHVRPTESEFEERLRSRLDATLTGGPIKAQVGLVSVNELYNWRYRIEKYLPGGTFDSDCIVKFVVSPGDIDHAIESLPTEEKVREGIRDGTDARLMAYEVSERSDARMELTISVECRNPDLVYDDLNIILSAVSEDVELSWIK